jgi:hypothetical protein
MSFARRGTDLRDLFPTETSGDRAARFALPLPEVRELGAVTDAQIAGIKEEELTRARELAAKLLPAMQKAGFTLTPAAQLSLGMILKNARDLAFAVPVVELTDSREYVLVVPVRNQPPVVVPTAFAERFGEFIDLPAEQVVPGCVPSQCRSLRWLRANRPECLPQPCTNVSAR